MIVDTGKLSIEEEVTEILSNLREKNLVEAS